MPHDITCPYCGEELSIWIDPGGGDQQSYVQDCEVCCRPIDVHVAQEESEGFAVYVARQDE